MVLIGFDDEREEMLIWLRAGQHGNVWRCHENNTNKILVSASALGDVWGGEGGWVGEGDQQGDAGCVAGGGEAGGLNVSATNALAEEHPSAVYWAKGLRFIFHSVPRLFRYISIYICVLFVY